MPKWPNVKTMTPERIQDYLERAQALRERLQAGRLDQTGPNSYEGVLERIQHFEAIAAFYALRHIQVALTKSRPGRVRRTVRLIQTDTGETPTRRPQWPQVRRPETEDWQQLRDSRGRRYPLSPSRAKPKTRHTVPRRRSFRRPGQDLVKLPDLKTRRL